ncbi:hypothetical protein SADUNF_Sadunf01G0080300 [Salix dunnii]|uniref:Uncharacterized protein n=1 Tax=Salix dunnii TaxID=1413687 RepID=A0A835NA94_9ROSI|nr:hypothetical protein SADUNF_Sadunf01G0080300 [Salix dunnii]
MLLASNDAKFPKQPCAPSLIFLLETFTDIQTNEGGLASMGGEAPIACSTLYVMLVCVLSIHFLQGTTVVKQISDRDKGKSHNLTWLEILSQVPNFASACFQNKKCPNFSHNCSRYVTIPVDKPTQITNQTTSKYFYTEIECHSSSDVLFCLQGIWSLLNSEFENRQEAWRMKRYDSVCLVYTYACVWIRSTVDASDAYSCTYLLFSWNYPLRDTILRVTRLLSNVLFFVVLPDLAKHQNGLFRFFMKEEEFVFSDIPEQPVPSLLRGFSAPIRLESDLSESELFFLLAHDSDEFIRWEAGQVLSRKLMLSLVMDFQQGRPLALNPKYVEVLRSILSDSNLDKEFIANAKTLPGEGEIMDMMEVADPDAVHVVENNRSSEENVFNHLNMARRALKNLSLAYLASLEDQELTELALHEYKTAINMTEQFVALEDMAQNPGKTRDEVVNKWFALQAMSDVPGNVENVRKLLNHPAFDPRNPNKVCNHQYLSIFVCVPHLHASISKLSCEFPCKGRVWLKVLGEIFVQLDKFNPQVASRMVSAFSRWKRYDETRQNLAKAQLETIVSANGLSENVFEIASKTLAA